MNRFKSNFFVLVIVFSASIQGVWGYFEDRLGEFFSLKEQGRHSILAQKLSIETSNSTLEDMRLFLLAESLKEAGANDQAIRVYSKLLSSYPDSWFAKKAGLNYVLLKTKAVNSSSFNELYLIAKKLPTSFTRGRALEEILNLLAPGSPELAKIALESLQEYRSDSSFYQEVKETQNLFKRIYSMPTNWRFTPEQWVEVLRLSFGVGLDDNFLAGYQPFTQALGPGNESFIVVLQADALRVSGKKDRALQLLDKIITYPSIQPAVRALAYQVRGDLLHFSNRHQQAVDDFEHAISWGKPPVDMVAANYRMMRSAFSVLQDDKAIRCATWLVENAPKISLFPGHLFEMGIERYDTGKLKEAVSYFMLLADHFPGHYRADDALGYASVVYGNTTEKGKKLLDILDERYPNSFFLYWLDPEIRNSKLDLREINTPMPESVQKRLAKWKILFKTPFAEYAKEEMRFLTDNPACELSVFRAIIELMTTIGDCQQLVTFAERLFKNTLDRGMNINDLPAWAWRAFYPLAYWSNVSTEAGKYRLDPYWALSIMREESHFNPKTCSKSNAMGLMQILPSTGKWILGKVGEHGKFHADMLWSIERNIKYGVWYLNYLKELFAGDMFLAAAAYNGGQGNIKRKVEEGPYAHLPVLSRLDRVPLPETRDYYKKVMGAWWNYRRVYTK
ncbi:MAG: transglycosylase SLT domain-containing protein [Candidatus Riflebacteria bacterium]|nr:transglycosylase SLT domain-containing protein [Candidatus Riflebacteria bacterium]